MIAWPRSAPGASSSESFRDWPAVSPLVEASWSASSPGLGLPSIASP